MDMPPITRIIAPDPLQLGLANTVNWTCTTIESRFCDQFGSPKNSHVFFFVERHKYIGFSVAARALAE